MVGHACAVKSYFRVVDDGGMVRRLVCDARDPEIGVWIGDTIYAWDRGLSRLDLEALLDPLVLFSAARECPEVRHE